MAVSLYRKYRPNVFSDVVGQEHVERTLVNAVTEGNVAHAYLFCGPRGTGKTTTARLLAKALLCEAGDGQEPDGTCPQCTDIAEGAHPDVYELDAASRTGVENVREEIIGRVSFAATRGRYKVYIIDEVHMLSTAAFNALLKTLEEPPEHVVFVLCTTDPHKVPETIQSRCQRFDFKRLSIEQIVRYLTRICNGEGFTFEPQALELIAAKSNGGMRDATTALEQLAVFSDGAITVAGASSLFNQVDADGLFDAAALVAAHDTAACFRMLARLVEDGADLAQFTHDFASHLRNLYVIELAGDNAGIVAASQDELARYAEQAHAFGAERLSRALHVCGELASELRHSSDARLSVEIAFTRLCRPESDLTLEALAERIAALEQGKASDAPQDKSAQANPHTPANDAETARLADGQKLAPAHNPEVHAARAGDQVPVFEHDQGARATRESADMPPARLMQAVLTEIKREDVATSALLGGVTLVQDGAVYHLEFPEGSEFAMSIASKDKARDLIATAFEHALGAPAQFDFRMAGTSGRHFEQADAGASPQAAARGQDTADAHEPATFAREQDPAPAHEPAADRIITAPIDDDPFTAPQAKQLDETTAANLADTLSAFGAGIKVREIEPAADE